MYIVCSCNTLHAYYCQTYLQDFKLLKRYQALLIYFLSTQYGLILNSHFQTSYILDTARSAVVTNYFPIYLPNQSNDIKYQPISNPHGLQCNDEQCYDVVVGKPLLQRRSVTGSLLTCDLW